MPEDTIKEVAKTVNKTLETSEKLGKFLSVYLKVPLEMAFGIVEDKLKYMRWERQIRLMQRASEFIALQGLEGKISPIQPKLGMPLLQAALLEEDDYLQDLWATLLVNACNPDREEKIGIKHINILNELTLYDVKLLEKICGQLKEWNEDSFTAANLPNELLPKGVDIEENHLMDENVQLSIENMVRLGIFRNESFSHFMYRVRITFLGWDFYRACTV